MEPSMRLRILISYHYYKDVKLDELLGKYFTEPYPEIFVDSGGFSAMTQGVHIDWREYGAWVKRWQHLLSVYANLDVIGDAQATAINQKRLEDMGLAPIPVFHTGSPFPILEGLIEQYPYIALGGMVPHMRFPSRITPWIIQCFKRAKGKAVFHGFGATSWKILSSFPWYSVDSSSWGQGFRFGQVPLFDETKRRFIKCSLGDRKDCQKHAKVIRALGFDWQDFADRNRNDRAKICAISALSYMKAEQWLRKRHGDIYIPHLADTSNGVNLGDADRGIKIHWADAKVDSGRDLAAAEAGIKTFLVDGPQTPLRDTAATDTGIKLHLAEHSLDRGGLGDTSRAMEVLNHEKGDSSR